jgi:hypothetical protein
MSEQLPTPPLYPTAPQKKKHPILIALLILGVLGLILVVIVIVIAGVGVKKGIDVAEEGGLINTETREGKLGEPIPCGNNLMLTLHDAFLYGGEDYYTPKEGYTFLILDLEFQNTGSETEAISSLMEMGVKDVAGREYNGYALTPKTPILPEGDISANEKVRGFVSFEVPNAALSTYTFKFDPLLGDAVLIQL